MNAAEILRARAAVRRLVSKDPDTLAIAGEIEALANLLDAIPNPLGDRLSIHGRDIQRIVAARAALERAICRTERSEG